MGRFFGSIHAFVGDDGRSALSNHLASAVSRWVTAGPFREIGADDPSTVHRTASLRGGPRWISLFCTEALTNEGSALAEQLARDTGLTMLWFRVRDSSLVQMGIYEAGAEVDHVVVDLDPPDRGTVLDEVRGPTAAAWERLLLDGVSGDDLREEWNSRAGSAEEKLASISTLIGLDPSRSQGHMPDSPEGGKINLRFTLTENSPWLAGAGSPPKLCLLPYSVFRRHGTMSSGLGPATIGQLVSCGGEGHGMEIEVGGVSAVRRQLENVRVRIQRGNADFENSFVVDIEPRDRIRNMVENLDIPRGAVDVATLANRATEQASAGDVLAALSFRLVLEAETRLRGDGELRIRVVPGANPAGEVAWKVPVSVS